MLKKLLIITFLASGVFNCNSNDLGQMQDLDLEKLNQELLTIQTNNPSTSFSISSLLEQLNLIIPSAQQLTVNISKDQTKSNYIVSITNLNVPGDDSISSYRYQLVLRNNEKGQLIFTKAQESWSCWPERGHQDFSAEKCQ